MVIIVAVIAFLLASSKGSGAQAIMNLVENAWGCFGSAFGPTILLSLFWRRFNYAGAIAGVVTGAGCRTDFGSRSYPDQSESMK